jgi:hypothetical protein
VVLTEIEGVIAEAYFAATGQRTRKINTLLDFTVDTAVKMAGGRDTLFFPAEFARYLKEYTYADFNAESDGSSAARHAPLGMAEPRPNIIVSHERCRRCSRLTSSHSIAETQSD